MLLQRPKLDRQALEGWQPTFGASVMLRTLPWLKSMFFSKGKMLAYEPLDARCVLFFYEQTFGFEFRLSPRVDALGSRTALEKDRKDE